MQTFVPYPDYDKTANVLDNSRLGNQCYRECKTLLNGGWPNHPASKMWRGYEYEFCNYAIALAKELINRGRVAVGERWLDYYTNRQKDYRDTGKPPWMGDQAFHASHRSNLLRKLPEHYRQYWPDEPDSLPYVWPV